MLNKNSTKRSENFKLFLIIAIVFVWALIPFSIDFKKVEFIKAETEINSEYIRTNTTWTLAGSPYIINVSYLFVDAVLTIEPGVIVKFGQNNMVVGGELIALGEKDKPIIFTSTNDDEAGGKAVSWSTGNPLPGDWGSIEVRGGRVVFDNVKIKYGGEVCVYLVRAKPVKLSTAYANWCSDNAVLSGWGDIAISNSEISNNKIGLSFYNKGSIVINNSKIYNNQGGGLINTGESQINAVNNWWGDDSGPYHQSLNYQGKGNAVVGDVLFNPWIGKAAELKRNPVILVPGFFGSWSVSGGELELDPILHAYDNLWEALQLAGYEQNKSLFAFPYDWRQSNVDSGLLLKQKINEVKSTCLLADLDDYDCEKVDLVAHSMGGLVSRSYIEGSDYDNDIDQMIFLATPHKGSPQAYLSWEGGDAGLGFEKLIMEKIIFSEAKKAGYLTNFSYIRNLPMTSIEELLPTFNYLRDKDSDSLRTYFFDYPRNKFLEDLNNPYNLEKMNKIRVLNIVADAGASSTISAFRVVNEDYGDGRWEHGYPENYGRLFTDHGLEYGYGDDTVPAFSNRGFNKFNEVVINDSGHLEVVTDAQAFVVEELTGLRPEQIVKKNFIKKFLLIRIFSPADFLIISPDGQRLGKDFINNQNINEIEGAFYSGFESEEEFATIPNPLNGEYEIKLLGTGDGEYRLSVSGINEATSTDKEFFSQINIGQEHVFSVDYSGDNLLEELEPQDVIAPDLTIKQPLDKVTYKHGDKMLIEYEVYDDFSGLSAVEIKIDKQEITTSTVDLFDYSLGDHVLSVIAKDKVGNFTEKMVVFSVISDIKSTIADIEEVYRRGWLKNLSQKDILVNELKVLEKSLDLLTKEKVEALKKIEEIKNNSNLSQKVKDMMIAQLNKKIAKVDELKRVAIAINLGIFEKTLNLFKKMKYLKQSGYDIIKSNLEYLKNNL